MLTIAKERVIDPERLRDWFNRLKPVLDAGNYPTALIFNMDETFLHPGGGKPELILSPRGVRPVVVDSNLEKGEHVTLAVVFRCSAA